MHANPQTNHVEGIALRIHIGYIVVMIQSRCMPMLAMSTHHTSAGSQRVLFTLM